MSAGRRGGGAAGGVAEDERGSVLLLTIGYAVLAIAVVLVCVDATSLHLAQRRLDAVADAAALAAADGFSVTVGPGGASARLDESAMGDLAADLIAYSPEASLASVDTPDGVSARVTVMSVWRPPILSVFVPDGVPLTATATSRTALG